MTRATRGSTSPFSSLFICSSSVRPSEAGRVPAIVVRRGRGLCGVVVERIIDVYEEAFSVEKEAAGRGTLGATTLGRQVTDLLDLDAVLRELAGEGG